MDVLGVIPAEGQASPTPTGALRTLLGVPLALWAVNNLARVLEAPNIVVVTESEDMRAAAERRGVRVLGSRQDLDVSRILVHEPLRPFCAPETIRAAIESGAAELGPLRTTPIERLSVHTDADLELARAVARGLPADHPCVGGVARMRFVHSGARAPARVAAIISDVDGVLTDGRVGMTVSGDEMRSFHMHDGLGTRLLIKAGVKVGWLSAAKDTGLVRRRAEYLGVHAVEVGEGEKGARFERMCASLGVQPGEAMYIGDDVNDLPAIERAGVSACPADARPEVRARVDVVLEVRGGAGCFREAADLVMALQGVTLAIRPRRL